MCWFGSHPSADHDDVETRTSYNVTHEEMKCCRLNTDCVFKYWFLCSNVSVLIINSAGARLRLVDFINNLKLKTERTEWNYRVDPWTMTSCSELGYYTLMWELYTILHSWSCDLKVITLKTWAGLLLMIIVITGWICWLFSQLYPQTVRKYLTMCCSETSWKKKKDNKHLPKTNTWSKIMGMNELLIWITQNPPDPPDGSQTRTAAPVVSMPHWAPTPRKRVTCMMGCFLSRDAESRTVVWTETSDNLPVFITWNINSTFLTPSLSWPEVHQPAHSQPVHCRFTWNFPEHF